MGLYNKESIHKWQYKDGFIETAFNNRLKKDDVFVYLPNGESKEVSSIQTAKTLITNNMKKKKVKVFI